MTVRKPSPQLSTWAQATARRPEARALDRRLIGIGIGSVLGFSYGLVSQAINRIALPGVPLYQPPAGPVGNTLLHILVGAGLGFLATWPNSAARGVLIGSIAAAVAIVGSGLLRLGGMLGMSSAALVGLLFSVPLAWLSVPVVALLRWMADRQVEASRIGAPLLKRIGLPLVVALILAGLAAFELLGDDAQSELRRTDALLRAGARATSAESLPAALRGPLVAGFPVRAGPRYTLEWTRYDLDRFIELRPAISYDQHAAVIARYESGYTLVCLYPTPKTEPNCGTY